MAAPSSIRAEAVRLFDEAKVAPATEQSLENLGKVRELVISILISCFALATALGAIAAPVNPR